MYYFIIKVTAKNYKHMEFQLMIYVLTYLGGQYADIHNYFEMHQKMRWIDGRHTSVYRKFFQHCYMFENVYNKIGETVFHLKFITFLFIWALSF